MSKDKNLTVVTDESPKKSPNYRKIAMIAAASLTAVAGAFALWKNLGDDSDDSDITLHEVFKDTDTTE